MLYFSKELLERKIKILEAMGKHYTVKKVIYYVTGIKVECYKLLWED